jgi:uncharacterized protein involved in exopolysaccharide biosynthesis
MANTYVELLRRRANYLASTTAGEDRNFVENRLGKARQDLANAEEALQAFEMKHKAVNIDAQSAALIDAVSQAQAQLVAKELELQVKAKVLGEHSPEITALKEGIQGLKNQLSKLEKGPGKSTGSPLVIPVDSVPELGKEYVRLMREFKAQEAIFETLLKQVEMAKMQEDKGPGPLRTLDIAVPADEPIAPKRPIFAVTGAMLGAVMYALWMALHASLNAVRRAEPQRFEAFASSLPAFFRRRI